MKTQYTKPPVGAHVRVVTEYRSTYYKDAPGTMVQYEHVGQVLPSDKIDPPNTFRVPGIIFPGTNHQHISLISLNNVVELEINGATAELSEVDEQNKVVVVKGSKNSEYVVSFINGEPKTCTCKGFTFRRSCKHLAIAAKNRWPAYIPAYMST